jgi:hypothetical protein
MSLAEIERLKPSAEWKLVCFAACHNVSSTCLPIAEMKTQHYMFVINCLEDVLAASSNN